MRISVTKKYQGCCWQINEIALAGRVCGHQWNVCTVPQDEERGNRKYFMNENSPLPF